MTKRILVGLVALFILGIPAVSSYPDRTITIVVPASPGGAMDFIGRLLAQYLPEKLNKPAVVENRPGGGTLIGSTAVAKARPDGHTLLVMPLGTLFNAILSKNSQISFDRDLVPVSMLVDDLLVLVVNSELPISSVAELIAYARSRPNELSFGTAGWGSLPDIAAQLLMNKANIKMIGIHYGGNTPAMTDLLAGRIHLLFLPLGSALPQIEAGKLRAVGVTTARRDDNAPAIPAISEELPGYALSSWQALMVTGGTPSAIVDQLNGVVQEIISRPEVLVRFRKLHLSRRAPASAEANKAFILSEFDKWKGVLQDVGLATQP